MPTASRAAASRRILLPPEEDSPVTRCLTRSRYLCPVAPVVPPEMRAATADMPPDELRELCGKLEDGKKTFFAGDSLTLQIHNELICLCGVKVKRRSAFVNPKGLSGSTVAQIFRKEVIRGGLRRGDQSSRTLARGTTSTSPPTGESFHPRCAIWRQKCERLG